MRVIYQNEVAECGYACLAMVLSHFGRATDVREISTFRPISSNGLTLTDLYDVATEFGLEVEAYQFGPEHVDEIPRGAILHFGGAHFVVFEKARRGYVRVIDPAVGRRRIAMDVFVASASGYLLQCSPTPDLPQVKARSKVRAALERVRTLNPQLNSRIRKVLFVAIGAQFAILATPFFGGLALDYVVASDNIDLLGALVLTFASIFVVGAMGHFVQGYLTEVVFGEVRMNMTEGLVGHLLRNPIPFFEKRNVGDLFAKIRMQEEVDDFVTRTAVTMRIDVAVALLGTGLMMLASGTLAAITLGLFFVYVMVAMGIFVRMRDVHALIMEESGRCDDALIETIRGASLIKLSGGELRRTGQFMSRFRGYVSAVLERSRLVIFRESMQKLLAYVDVLVITWLACRLMLSGSMSLGVFYSFMIYKSLVTERLTRVINGLIAYGMLSAPVGRVADIADAEGERYSTPDALHRSPETRSFQSLEMQNVSFRYGVSDQWILKEVSLTLRKGDKVAIVGPSGSGKSTIFKLLAASEPLHDGEILLNGIRWPNLAVDEIRRHAAHMRQGDIILYGSIADNVSMFTGQTDEDRVRQVLEDVGLMDDVMRLPMRARTVVSDTIANISAGQRQRLLLARALYMDREVLMLDEPTSNLDPSSVELIARLLAGIDRTVVVITHDHSLASHFDRRFELRDGRLVPAGKDAVQVGKEEAGTEGAIADAPAAESTATVAASTMADVVDGTEAEGGIPVDVASHDASVVSPTKVHAASGAAVNRLGPLPGAAAARVAAGFARETR
ncbi:peptidase domain-containing ABC transporter [Dyella japonica]|uniref:Bacitracin ABC transporter ATPase n=1 Tax=Dyella japonica A8 TaxID=1217721 RepID=A0A075K0D0_9GAMM|nr:peptidase domain-containing ABC transporter [Dyella japonica]AIF47242.1 bacitracin ABC transporter ATPase [Dyella japonica A8]